MNDPEIYPADPQATIDLAEDLDDVEGHGLKEVAAGLGAAAVLAGGAAGATQLASSSAQVHPSKGDVSITVTDPVGTASQATHAALGAAQTTADTAFDATGKAIDGSITAVHNAPGTASRLVNQTLDSTGKAVDKTVGTATSTVKATEDWATGPVVDTAKGDVHSATSTVQGTKSSATATASSAASSSVTTAGTTVRDADRKLATILSVVTTTAADGVHTATVTLKAAQAGAGVDTSTAGGWVLVKAGDTVLAQVHLTNGTATASWKMPLVGGHAVTISYTGDNTFAASMRSVTL